jgi:hypothetical protein
VIDSSRQCIELLIDLMGVCHDPADRCPAAFPDGVKGSWRIKNSQLAPLPFFPVSSAADEIREIL